MRGESQVIIMVALPAAEVGQEAGVGQGLPNKLVCIPSRYTCVSADRY